MSYEDTVGTERLLGRVLLIGTRASTVALAAGLVLALFRPSAVSGVLLHVGLLVLMATPVLRVIVSIGAFARRREWHFVLLTSCVLAFLLIGLVLAIAA